MHLLSDNILSIKFKITKNVLQKNSEIYEKYELYVFFSVLFVIFEENIMDSSKITQNGFIHSKVLD